MNGRMPNRTSGRLLGGVQLAAVFRTLGVTLGVALGGSVAGCSSGSAGTTSSAASTTAGSTGSSTGAPAGTSSAGSSTGAASSGGTSGGTSSGGSSTGGIEDGGCDHLGTVDSGGLCILTTDCQCPLTCVGFTCQELCSHDSDCPAGNWCVSGSCQPVSLCSTGEGAEPFESCGQSSDCACPSYCFADFVRGAVCERRCNFDADCSAPDQFCEGDAGSCQRTENCYGGDAGLPALSACGASFQCTCPLSCFDGLCEPACTLSSECQGVGDAGQFCEGDAGACTPISYCNPTAGSTEFLGCAQTADCQCPLECVVDPRRGPVCELPCTDGSSCASDEICEGDAGACQRTSGCFGGDAGASEWSGCTGTIQCACPLTCIVDPSFATGGPMLCEQCDAGTSCEPPGGACVDAGALAAEAQYGPDSSLWTGCGDNSVCDCPNQCLPIAGGASWACQLPPACGSNADCPDPTTTCISGGCIPNLCPPGAAVTQFCDVAFGQDNPAVTDDGECLPDFLGGAHLLCVQGGTASSGCSLPQDRNDPDTLCPGGSVCVAADGGNLCAPACQIAAAACPTGSTCSSLNPADPLSQYPDCLPVLYAPQACLPSLGACTNDLPTYEPAGSPFNSAAVGAPFAPCSGTNCLCPSTCTYDFFLSQVSYDATSTFCEPSCITNSDCAWPQTSCNGGVCGLDRSTCTVAVPGGIKSNMGAACSDGTAAGTCVYFSPYVMQPGPGGIYLASTVAVCRTNGTATSTCDPTAQRGAAGLCGAGTDCLPLPDGGFGCLKLCDPISDAGSCSAGQTCAPATRYANGINEGTCQDLGDAGCALGLADNEFAPCRREADCACGLSCVADPNLPVGAQWTTATTFCERPCTQVTDCALDEYCFGRVGERNCRLNLCADVAPVPPTCNADSASSGTCLAQGPGIGSLPFMPATPPSALAAFGLCASEPALSCIPGLCLQGGTATGACDPNADRSTPDLLCVPGAICDTSGSTPMCTWLCTVPNSAGLCPDGEVCLPLPGAATVPMAGNLQGDCQPAMGVDAGA